ncbi:MAG: PDZ domain-containing protein, partial [Acidobacteriota bacterium]
PDGKKIGFADKRAAYYYVDLETKAVKKVFFDAHLGSVNFVTASWSPDGNWLAYASGNPNWYGSIHLFSLENDKTYRVTDEYTHASEPQFDPEGKFLYWIADSRIHVENSYWDGGHYRIDPSIIVAVALQKEPMAPPAAAPESAPAARELKAVPIRIDVEELGQRIKALPIEDSSYRSLAALEGRLIYLSEPAHGESALKMFDLAAQKESVLLKDAWYAIPAARADKIVYRAAGTIGILDIKPGLKAGEGRIDLSGLNMTIDYGKEWRQIFDEAWRIQRDFFFDENLHGVDWAAMKRKYAALLPQVASRQDLNRLIADLFSELGQSHMEISGGDLPEIPKVHNGLLGVDLDLDQESRLYRIAGIYGGQTRDVDKRGPLTLPGMNIRRGDFLLAIDGTPLKEGVNPDSLLENKAGVAVVLTVHDKPASAGSRTVTVTPAEYSEQQGDLLRYDDWVWGNIARVSQATGGKVGYIHLPDTYVPGMESFFRFFYPQLDKQALIVDVRFNGGGYPPIWMIERLNRKLIYYSHFPHGKVPLREPDPVFGGALACLTNEWSESGGEVFAATFRQMDCGPLIGRRTSGCLASTGGYRLVDGGVLVYPAEGKQNGQGESVIENIGVSPDIDVINRPDDMIKNRDAQLERAVDEVMKQLRARDH